MRDSAGHMGRCAEMIRFDQVSFGYDGGKTIDRLSFHIAPGECTAIIGPNGAGKST
ncbi:MAG: ATP-binding cassette domain-containing protein, partial [Clostridia bacterium]|nr:ATP-binding cassette domain-containing protein [Clostridia bacterium]